MITFKVQPYNKRYNYNAPCLYIDSLKEEIAIKEAQQTNTLSRFESWAYRVVGSFEIKRNKLKNQNND